MYTLYTTTSENTNNHSCKITTNHITQTTLFVNFINHLSLLASSLLL